MYFPSFNDDLGTMPTRHPNSWKKESLCSAAFAALVAAGIVKVGAVRLAWAASLLLAEATVSMGDAAAEGSSEASAAFVSEACSSSVLPS